MKTRYKKLNYFQDFPKSKVLKMAKKLACYKWKESYKSALMLKEVNSYEI